MEVGNRAEGTACPGGMVWVDAVDWPVRGRRGAEVGDFQVL